MIIENTQVLEFKNFHIFYENLYNRLFGLINHLIDENQFNIISTKDKVTDFLDSYSYYIISKKVLKRSDADKSDNETDESILKKLRDFDSFSQSLSNFPSKEYSKILMELKRQDINLSKLNQINYNILIKEYYDFFNETIIILRKFIEVASINGFLPVMKNKNSLKTIGFANYKSFFMELENLKLKMSEVTTTIKLNNVFKCRRCVYSVLTIFSPYFKRENIFLELSGNLDFKFLYDEELMKQIKRSYDYDSFYSLPNELKISLSKNVLDPIKRDISLIKRYMSYEFGEIDMSPKLKRKFSYDPTRV